MADLKLDKPTKDVASMGLTELLNRLGTADSSGVVQQGIVATDTGSFLNALVVRDVVTVTLTMADNGTDSTGTQDFPFKGNRVYAVPPKLIAFRRIENSGDPYYQPIPLLDFSTTKEVGTNSYFPTTITKVYSYTDHFNLDSNAPLGTVSQTIVVGILIDRAEVDQ